MSDIKKIVFGNKPKSEVKSEGGKHSAEWRGGSFSSTRGKHSDFHNRLIKAGFKHTSHDNDVSNDMGGSDSHVKNEYTHPAGHVVKTESHYNGNKQTNNKHRIELHMKESYDIGDAIAMIGLDQQVDTARNIIQARLGEKATQLLASRKQDIAASYFMPQPEVNGEETN
jgi:hypothetical protein